MIGSTSIQAANRYRFVAVHATRSISWSAIDLLLAWHLHENVGLSGSITGFVLFASLVAGGAATLAAGIAFRRYRASGRAVVQVQLPATVASAVLLWMQFHVRSVMAILLVGLAFRLAYAVQDVAQNMLASLLPADEADTRRYARLRVMLSGMTRCAVAGVFAIASLQEVASLLVITGLAMVGAAVWLRGSIFPDRRADATRRGPVDRERRIGLRSLLAAWAMAATLLPTLNRLLIFAPATDDLPGMGAWLLGGYCLGTVAGPLTHRSVSGPVLVFMIAGSGLLMATPLPILTPDHLRIVGAIVHGAAISMVGTHLWSNTARLAQDEARRGRFDDGVIFGSVIVSIHLASAAGMLITGPLIDGFEKGRIDTSMTALGLTAIGALLVELLGLNGRRPSATA